MTENETTSGVNVRVSVTTAARCPLLDAASDMFECCTDTGAVVYLALPDDRGDKSRGSVTWENFEAIYLTMKSARERAAMVQLRVKELKTAIEEGM